MNEKSCFRHFFSSALEKSARSQRNVFAGGKQARPALIATNSAAALLKGQQNIPVVIRNTYEVLEVLDCSVTVLLCAQKNRVYMSLIGVISKRSNTEADNWLQIVY